MLFAISSLLQTPSPVPELSFLPAPYRVSTRAGERRVQDNLHAHAQNDAIISPQNRGKNHIWKYFPDLARGTIFWMTTHKQQFLHLDWLKTCQKIPNQWNFTSATLTHIRFVFHRNIKDNERNLCQVCWQLKTRTRAALCKWATCTRQTFLSKTFAKSLNKQKKYEKNVWKKNNDAYSLSIRVQSTINHISIFTLYVFYDNINVKENVFFQSASWKRHCATHWREQRGWDPVIFDWFALSMRVQVILDSSFARSGWAPIWGGKKGEFRDWTNRHPNLGLKINRSNNFSSTEMFFTAYVLWSLISLKLKTEGQKYKQKTSPKMYKNETKIIANPGLVLRR